MAYRHTYLNAVARVAALKGYELQSKLCECASFIKEDGVNFPGQEDSLWVLTADPFRLKASSRNVE
jgi:hypothetical protein